MNRPRQFQWGTALMLIGIALIASGEVAAATFYVATTGNDANPGTLSRPWRTLQKAANTVAPGSVVYVRGGVYKERVTLNVSGSASDGFIKFQNYPTETPIVDGTGLAVPAMDTGLFLIANRSYILIKGFELCNYRTAVLNRTPVGIHVRGMSHHIQLRGNHIHHIEHNGIAVRGVDALGIAVYGTHATQAINHVVIDGNELYALTLGSSESLALSGNVDGFQVTNNRVHDNNNIGILAAGFEGVSPDPATDQARNGLIARNRVYDIDSYGNPAYGNVRAADGIYVDGGRNIVIERNRVHHANIGIEIASEHKGRAARYVTARSNFVYLNDVMGISIGGYDTQRGGTYNCSIINNTLFHNDRLQDGNGELLLQFDTRNNTVKNNIFYANAQNYFIVNPYPQNTGNVVDYNLYYSPAGAANGVWQWKNIWYTGFAAYRAGTGNDVDSHFVNPRLASTSTPDLHLQVTSPAIDRGQNLSNVGAFDIDGEVRSQNVIDIGADEVR